MKKKISLLIMCILSMFLSIDNIYAKQVIKLKECAYTEAFKRYMKLSDEEKAKTIMPMICKSDSNLVTSSLGTSSVLGSITDSKFDLRKLGKVTDIRTSHSKMNWTFAANAAVESNLLVNGYGKYDLSEAHMELATQNTFKTPYKTLNRSFLLGGNIFFSAPYFINYLGSVSEQNVPIEIIDKLTVVDTEDEAKEELNKLDKYETIIDVNNVSVYHNGEEGVECSKSHESTEFIKKKLINNGAVIAGYNHYVTGILCDDTTKICEEISPYLNNSYYYADDATTGYRYSVIVGWDDTISKDNFNSEHKPTEDGAWIVKGYYDPNVNIEEGYELNYGDNGYYYVSYQNPKICTLIASFDTDIKRSDNIYYHDYINYLSSHYISEENIYTLGIFNKKTKNKEVIDKIILEVPPSTNQDYEVFYKEGPIDLVDNFAGLVRIASGTMKETGYMSVELEKEIYVDDVYSIVILYKKNDSTQNIKYPVTVKYESVYFEDYEPPQLVTFISNDGVNWEDTSTKGFTPVLKVYTSNVEEETTTSKKEETTTSKKEETTTSKKEETTTSKKTTTTKKTTTKKQEEVEIKIEENEENEESYIDTTPSEDKTNKEEKENDEKNPSTFDTNIFGIVSMILVLGSLIFVSIKKIFVK